MIKTMGFKENLKSELTYTGMLVKELAAKSGVNKHSINNYLNRRGQTPSVEAAVKIAHALGVSVEYLVTGEENSQKTMNLRLSNEARYIARHIEQLNDKNRKFVMDFVKWIKSREDTMT
jgi:transcriptional regulator with XRE-family HTH domain